MEILSLGLAGQLVKPILDRGVMTGNEIMSDVIVFHRQGQEKCTIEKKSF